MLLEQLLGCQKLKVPVGSVVLFNKELPQSDNLCSDLEKEIVSEEPGFHNRLLLKMSYW